MTTINDIELDLVTGKTTWPDTTTSCYTANPSTLDLLGAVYPDSCTPAPSSTETLNVEVDEETSAEPNGVMPEEGVACSGGGNFTIAAGKKIKNITGKSYRDKPGLFTGNYTDAEMDANCLAEAQSKLLSHVRNFLMKAGTFTKCETEMCANDCVEKTFWLQRVGVGPKWKWTLVKRERFNVGSSTEVLINHYEVTSTVAEIIIMHCDCPATDE